MDRLVSLVVRVASTSIYSVGALFLVFGGACWLLAWWMRTMHEKAQQKKDIAWDVPDER